MSTLILDPPRSSVLAQGWIISKREDLTWFIGSSLAGYVALAGLVAGFPVITAALIWHLAIDGPHVFATTSRTYFDKAARRNLGWRLWLLIPLMLAGPVMWFTGLSFLFILVLTWAQYHVAKQHFGFVMLYKRKTGERSDITLDRRFLLVSLMLPWALYVFSYLDLGTQKITLVASLAYAGFVVFYVGHQIGKATRGEVCNLPKLLLLSIIIPLHWIAFAYAATHTREGGLMIAAIATNIGHSLQYQRLTWFHNRNRYAESTRATNGLASIVNSRLTTFLLTAIVLNLLLTAIPNYAMRTNGALLSMLAGLNMMHFYLDSLIWRTRSDKGLANALRV